jgi:hypothetical protein
MNKPIQTEGRNKKNRDRRHQDAGPQSELNDILSNVPDSKGSVSEAIFKNLSEDETPHSPALDAAIAAGRTPFGEQREPDVLIAPDDESENGYQAPPGIILQEASPQPYEIPNELSAADGQVLREQCAQAYIGEPVAISGEWVSGVYYSTPEPLGSIRINPQSEVQQTRRYEPKDLITMIVRHRTAASEAQTAAMSRVMAQLPESVQGLQTGFLAKAGNGNKLTCSRRESKLRHVYVELRDKELTHFFDDWYDDLAMKGINEATTIDFWLVEPSVDGKTVIDAWYCSHVYPESVGAIESSRVDEVRGYYEPVRFEVEFAGTVERSKKHRLAAQKLLDEMNLVLDTAQ